MAHLVTHSNADHNDGHNATSAGLLVYQMKSGLYYAAYSGVTTSTTYTTDTMYATPLIIPASVTLDRIGIGCTGAVASTVVRLGIYADDGNGYPAARTLDAGTVSTATTGSKEITISQALSAGLYWLVAANQTTAGTKPTLKVGNGPTNPGALCVGSTSGGQVSAQGYSHASVTGAFPTPWTSTVTSEVAPLRVFVRVA